MSRIILPAFLFVAFLFFCIGAYVVPKSNVTTGVTQLVTIRETVTITRAIPTTSTSTGKTMSVRLGQTFTVTMNNQPIEVKCTGLRFENKMKLSAPASGYRYAVIDLEFRNLGAVEARTAWSGYDIFNTVLKLNTGYSYKPTIASEFYSLSVKPGIMVAGYICFEIPSDSIPIEMHIITNVFSLLPEIVLSLT